MGRAAKDLLNRLKGAAGDLLKPFSEDERQRRQLEDELEHRGERTRKQPPIIGVRG